MPPNRLTKAIEYLKQGKKDQARKLIISEVKENPSNLSGWLWALEVANNEKEKRTILQKILSLDPTHTGALQYLKKLDQRQSGLSPHKMDQRPGDGLKDKPPPEKNISRVGGLIRFITDWILTLPASCGILALFMVSLVGLFIYFRVNTSFFGLAGADFNELVISNSYERISTEDMYWEVQFEGRGESKYIGTVRHAGPIRMKEFPILTHDILITTADFANPDIVETSVVDHKYFWKSSSMSSPNGSINLIHAIPVNQEIYQALLEVQKWDTLKVTGREILSVKAFQRDGEFIGTWQDLGCNTLLIESVSLLKAESEN